MNERDLRQILPALDEVLKARKTQKAKDSYVASLYDKGLDAINGKILEESREVTEAADASVSEVVHEIADLWFHCMVLLAYRDLSSDDVLLELTRRFGVSGTEEKASRTK